MAGVDAFAESPFGLPFGTRHVAISPDGARLAYASSAGI